jgi:pimeloyl-ACP methyl ester carboxylesterase
MRGTSRGRPGDLTPPGRFVLADGARVHYVQSGEGPPLVFVHGAKGSVYDFTLSVGPLLAQRYATTAFDRPGSGFSGRPAEGDNGPEEQARILRSAARQIGIRSPILVGHSFGAAVALAWALAAPDDVAAVVTLGAYALPLGGPPAWAVKLMEYPAVLGAVGFLGRSSLGRPLVRAGLKSAFGPAPVSDEYAAIAPRLALQPAALRSDAADYQAVQAGLAALRSRYPALQVPLVILVGTEDQAVSPEVSERLHALVPRSELVRVPGSGHMPQFSAPDAVVAAVDRAAGLAGVSTTGPAGTTPAEPAVAT